MSVNIEFLLCTLLWLAFFALCSLLKPDYYYQGAQHNPDSFCNTEPVTPFVILSQLTSDLLILNYKIQ